MQNEEGLTPSERELAEALGRLRPAPVSIDRDRLIFEAGRRSVRRSLYAWRAVAAVLVAAVGLSLATRPQPQPTQRGLPSITARSDAGPSVLASAGSGGTAYLELRDRVLEKGLDALPAWTSAAPMRLTPALFRRVPSGDSSSQPEHSDNL